MTRLFLVLLCCMGCATLAAAQATVDDDDSVGYINFSRAGDNPSTTITRTLTSDEILKDPMAVCQQMAVGPVRTHCFMAAAALLDIERRLTSYTVIQYGCAGEITRWSGRDLNFASGVEFTDTVSGHRVRLDSNWAVESNTDKISESESEE